MGEGWRSRTEEERRGASQRLPGGRGSERKPEQVQRSRGHCQRREGPAGSQPAHPRVDQLQAAGEKLPRIRLELPDTARPSPAASQLGGEVSLREGTLEI